MYSLQYRPHMGHNTYEENGGGSFAAAAPIFWILGMVYLWPILLAVHGLCTAYVWPVYMAYVWPTYGTYRVQICDQFYNQVCSTHRSPGCPGRKVWSVSDNDCDCGYSSVDSLLGGNFSVLVIKLDHEVGLRHYWYQYRAKFRAGSFDDSPESIRGQFKV